MVDETTPVLCGSLSEHPTRLGVRMHNAGFAALGLDFRYVAIGTSRLQATVAALRTLRFRGFAVSMPFKLKILEHLDRCSPETECIGACNTVLRVGDELVGHNVDGLGALAALDELGAELPASAVVVGAGGVARAIAHELKSRGMSVYVAARNKAQRSAMVTELGLDGHTDLAGQGAFRAPLVVQATPDSRWPGSPVDPALHPEGFMGLDVVSERRATPLTEHLRRLGWQVADGWRMRLHQAMHQFRLYTGQPAPGAIMEAALNAALDE